MNYARELTFGDNLAVFPNPFPLWLSDAADPESERHERTVYSLLKVLFSIFRLAQWRIVLAYSSKRLPYYSKQG